ncbi:hypothetical protein K3369_20130 [Pseudomonas mandelii]|uniref:hypothetical protein n=1 Tax=Pseudomonas mandelii TaxID=75612 RepID=UPI001C840365|nr:hypothetical protein [Pseudomonas mandelii]QZA96066.1 hypothetical protein K3369_20130 [Pseudomonas mandelii]
MYIRMTQNCDRVVVLKSISSAVAAFDADGHPLKGFRKSSTEQIAAFDLQEPIIHPEIPAEKAIEFEVWRSSQISRIHKAFIDAAAGGKLGGTPILKTRSAFGDQSAKVGEFSGLIKPVIEVQAGLIKGAMSGQKAQPNRAEGARTLAEEMAPDAISEAMIDLAEKIIRFIHLSNKKGTDLYTIGQTLDIRRAYSALGCATDKRGIGYTVAKKLIEGRNAATEGMDLFIELKKRVTE